MPVSPAKKAANRQNSLVSTGPKTLEGKARSRRNGLKHGLTGEGLVLPDEDVEAVKAKFARLKADMKPKSELGLTLVERIATLSVKMHRSSEYEAACLSEYVRTAPMRFDNDRFTEVEHLLNTLEDDPATNCRRLQETPEGIKMMLDSWIAIRQDLVDPEREIWDHRHLIFIENLMYRKPDQPPLSRAKALYSAMFGNFHFLPIDEPPDAPEAEKKAWAKKQMIALLDERIEKFTAYQSKLDLDGVAKAREESKKRAKFDPSKEAILARKYEAANAREFYKAIDKFYEVEDRARIAHEEEEDDATSETIETSDTVASVCPGPITHPRRSVPGDLDSPRIGESSAETGQIERLGALDREIPGPS